LLLHPKRPISTSNVSDAGQESARNPASSFLATSEETALMLHRNKMRLAILVLAGGLLAGAQTFGTSGTRSLNGPYFVRELALLVSNQGSNTGAITRALSLSGTITFDGNGNYTFSGQLLDSSQSSTQPQSYNVSGGYGVSANGLAQIQSLVSDQD